MAAVFRLGLEGARALLNLVIQPLDLGLERFDFSPNTSNLASDSTDFPPNRLVGIIVTPTFMKSQIQH